MPRAALVALASVLLLGGCAGSRPPAEGPTAALRGTVTYLPRIALPPDAVVTVRLLDVSLADAPAVTLGAQTLPMQGRQVPVPFTLAYDPSRIDARHRYVVRAEIRDGTGALRWTTDTAYPVLTQGAPSSGVEIRVVQVPERPAPAPPPDEPVPPSRARTAAFDCTDAPDGAFRFTVWARDDEATVWLPARFGGGSVLLDRVETASGTRYEGDRLVVWTHGDEARLEVRGATYTGCRRAE